MAGISFGGICHLSMISLLTISMAQARMLIILPVLFLLKDSVNSYDLADDRDGVQNYRLQGVVFGLKAKMSVFLIKRFYGGAVLDKSCDNIAVGRCWLAPDYDIVAV